MKRLNYLYENAMEVKFDDGDNIVFISDIHRGDGTFMIPFFQTEIFIRQL